MILKFVATPAGNTFARGVLFTWDTRDYMFQCARENEKKKHVHNAFFQINNQIKCDGVMHIPSLSFDNLWKWCLSSWSIKFLRFENWNFPILKKIGKCKHHLLHVSFFLILTRALEHVVCLGESRLSHVSNSPQANVFPAGVANFGKATYRSLESPARDTRDGSFLHSAQASFSWPSVDLARL